MLKGRTIESGEHISRFAVRFILHGKMNFRIESENISISQPSLINFNTGSPYELQIPDQEGDSLQVGFAFRPSFINSFAASLLLNEGQLLDDPGKTNTIEFRPGASHLQPSWMPMISELKEYATGENFSFEKREELAYRVLRMYYRNIFLPNHYIERDESKNETRNKRGTKQELLRRLAIARELIESEDPAKLNIPFLSRQSCLSEFHFIRSYRKVYRESPYKHIIERRLADSLRLLLTTAKPIEEIAMEVGYQEKSSFSRSFRSRFQMAPAAVREGRKPVPLIK